MTQAKNCRYFALYCKLICFFVLIAGNSSGLAAGETRLDGAGTFPPLLNRVPTDSDGLLVVSGENLGRLIRLGLKSQGIEEEQWTDIFEQFSGLPVSLNLVDRLKDVAVMLNRDTITVNQEEIETFVPWLAIQTSGSSDGLSWLRELIKDSNAEMALENDITAEITLKEDRTFYAGFHGDTLVVSLSGQEPVQAFSEAVKSAFPKSAMKCRWGYFSKDMKPWNGGPLLMIDSGLFTEESPFGTGIEQAFLYMEFSETSGDFSGNIYPGNDDGLIPLLLRIRPGKWRFRNVPVEDTLAWISIQLPGDDSFEAGDNGWWTGLMMALNLEYERDIQSWLGTELALSIVSPEKADDFPDLVLMLEAVDQDRLLNTLGKLESALAGYGMIFTPEAHRGRTVKVLAGMPVAANYAFQYVMMPEALIIATSRHALVGAIERYNAREEGFVQDTLDSDFFNSGTISGYLNFLKIIPAVEGALAGMAAGRGVEPERIDDRLEEISFSLHGGDVAVFRLGLKAAPLE